jgi:hypothetical protein
MDINKLNIATNDALNYRNVINSEVELMMWAQDQSLRYSDKIHDFTKDDAVAQVLNVELFDMVLRMAVLFGFNVGYNYATLKAEGN